MPSRDELWNEIHQLSDALGAVLLNASPPVPPLMERLFKMDKATEEFLRERVAHAYAMLVKKPRWRRAMLAKSRPKDALTDLLPPPPPRHVRSPGGAT